MKKLFFFFVLCSVVSFHAMAMNKVVIAHRGLSGTYPENTMISFKQALKTKAQFIELDVHLSKDNQLMVMHDENLDRTTNGIGVIGQYTAKELSMFSAGFSKKFGRKFSKEKIPMLVDVLDLIENSDKGLLIEIKSHDLDPKYNKKVGPIVYNAVMENFPQMKDRVAFISFNVAILEEIRKLDKSVRVGPIFHALPKEGSLADQALKLNTDIVVFSKKLLSLSQEVIEHPRQVKHFVYTVLPPEFKDMDETDGLYGFATDFADLIDE